MPRQIGQLLTDKTLATEVGQALGTPDPQGFLDGPLIGGILCRVIDVPLRVAIERLTRDFAIKHRMAQATPRRLIESLEAIGNEKGVERFWTTVSSS